MKLIKFGAWALVSVWGLILIFIFVVLETEKTVPEDMIQMPFSLNEVANERVSTVKMVLEDVGFTRISLELASDRIPANEEGIVYRVQVGDSSSFSSGDPFPPDVSIIIFYK